MNKKLLTMISGSVLAAVLLAGCNLNNQEPPPENDINEPGVNDNDRNNDLNNNNGVDRNNDTDLNNNNDINTNNDGDMMKDNNDPGEDLIEDRLDRRDENNKDR